MKFKFKKAVKKLFKGSTKKRSGIKGNIRKIPQVTRIDQTLIKTMLKRIIFGMIAKTQTPIGFVFDNDSIVTSSGRLVGAQSTMLPTKGATIVFYIECLFSQFEIDQKNNLTPNHENLLNLDGYLKKIVADQIFAIESQPQNHGN